MNPTWSFCRYFVRFPVIIIFARLDYIFAMFKLKNTDFIPMWLRTISMKEESTLRPKVIYFKMKIFSHTQLPIIRNKSGQTVYPDLVEMTD